MAEIWPKLKGKFVCETRRRRKKSSKANKANNPHGSSGLEKLTALLKGVQAKKNGASVSVGARRSERKEGSESPEVVVLHCAVRPSDAQTRSSEFTESFSIAEAGFNPRFVEVEKSQPESESASEPERPAVGSLQRDLGNLSEDRECQGDNFTEKASSARTLSVALPVRTGRCMKKIRSLQRSGWKQTSNSAFVVLVALGTFISSHFGKVGNPLAAVLTFNAVVRVWREGKLYTRFSSVALYFLTPLRSYLTYCPRRLSLLPRKLKVVPDTASHLSTAEVSRNPDVDGRDSSLKISVLPLESLPPADAPLALLLTIPESSATPTVALVSSAIEPISAMADSGASSPTRRLAKKFSSSLKKLKMFRSSTPSSVSLSRGFESAPSSPNYSATHFTGPSETDSPVSPSFSSSAASSSDRHRKCPFPRRRHKSKSDIPSESTDGEEASVRHVTEKKMSVKKSRFCRTSSTDAIDLGDITGSAKDSTPTSRPRAAEEATDSSRNVSWPVVGLLVTLLFLIVGRVPAIMATSLFILVVSNAHHDRARPRSRGRAFEAARKLHRSPPPRRHPGSPARRY